jgi:hypothetical protein
VKKLFLLLFCSAIGHSMLAQYTPKSKNEKKESRRKKVSELVKQAEEGVLVYSRQTIFGFQLRSNGYGAYFEMGRMKTNKRTNIYRLDITEIKHPKEEKQQGAGVIFGNPFVYGKVNNFYQVTLGFGQQLILGQKGNKNGVAVSAVYSGGLALGLLKPYYLEVQGSSGGQNEVIKYTEANKDVFLGSTGIVGSGGFGKGWNELSVKPGAFAKAGMRFDYGRFNEVVNGLEIGLSGEFYSSKIPIMLEQKDKQFFIQGYLSILFGRRK